MNRLQRQSLKLLKRDPAPLPATRETGSAPAPGPAAADQPVPKAARNKARDLV